MVSTRNTATQTRGGNRRDSNFRAGLYLAQREKRWVLEREGWVLRETMGWNFGEMVGFIENTAMRHRWGG